MHTSFISALLAGAVVAVASAAVSAQAYPA